MICILLTNSIQKKNFCKLFNAEISKTGKLLFNFQTKIENLGQRKIVEAAQKLQ